MGHSYIVLQQAIGLRLEGLIGLDILGTIAKIVVFIFAKKLPSFEEVRHSSTDVWPCYMLCTFKEVATLSIGPGFFSHSQC